MRLFVIILSLGLQGSWFLPCAGATEADMEWKDAVAAAKEGENDFAFLDFRTLLRDYPGSPYAMAAEFAQGEYYFQQNNLSMAQELFSHIYERRHPQDQEAMAALIYLFKIAQIRHDPSALDATRTQIANFRQLTFIFKDKKSFKFISGFQNRYRLVYYIDKVDLYVNNQLFAEVPF